MEGIFEKFRFAKCNHYVSLMSLVSQIGQQYGREEYYMGEFRKGQMREAN